MNIDERLQALVQSTEFLKHPTQSLHQTMAETVERIDRDREAREREQEALRQADRKHRLAIMQAIQAYLDEMTNGHGEK